MIVSVNNPGLTNTPLTAILPTLFPHEAVRGESRKNQQMPIARLIHRLRFHMQKFIYGGRYLGSFGSHGSVAMSLNPDNVHRQIFERISGVLKHSTEANTMSQNNSAQQSEQTNTQAAISAVKLPENYPVECKEDFFVLVCKTDELAPLVWRDMLMLMREDFKAQVGDVIMVNPDRFNSRLEFCKVAGVYPAVCVAAKPQILEILPDGTVSKPV